MVNQYSPVTNLLRREEIKSNKNSNWKQTENTFNKLMRPKTNQIYNEQSSQTQNEKKLPQTGEEIIPPMPSIGQSNICSILKTI